MADPASSPWEQWHAEIEAAKKAPGLKTWQDRGKKIVKRYRDERKDATADPADADLVNGARFNILWSNIQTLMPAIYAKPPKPVVERRYLDKDEIGRTASVILERALKYELDDGSFFDAVKRAVLDRLLPGRGIAWVRYVPQFAAGDREVKAAPKSDDEALPDEGKAASPATAESDLPSTEEVVSESVEVDYVAWQDFLTDPARTWPECRWIARRVYLTRKQGIDRFGADKFKDIPLDWTPAGQTDAKENEPNDERNRAVVWEVWDKVDRKARWLAETAPDDGQLLDEKDDPLRLRGFFPCAQPLQSTTTNETMIPVSDYYEYQDQARELDDLTTRITNLTKTIKTCGVYDASVTELRRMFEEGFENQLVPCDNMVEFSQKSGANGMGHIWLLPIKDMAGVLIQLYDARERVKQIIYEVTGISDIVRGQASGAGDKTATEQRIKGQFASMRLNDMQSEVARFARDTLRVMGEIIAEHYSDDTLYEISGFEEYAKDQWPVPPAAPAPQQPMMGHNGGPPLAPDAAAAAIPPGVGAAAGGVPVQAPGLLPPMNGQQINLAPTPEMQAQAKRMEMFKKAVQLLRNDKLRGFRIDIETDSMIEADRQETQRSRTELLKALSQFLPQAIEAGSQVPEMAPLMGQLVLFFLRGFPVGRDLESSFEQMIDNMQKQARSGAPKPPTPEEIKAQAEMQNQKAETERMQMQADLDQQKGQQELQLAQAKNAMELERMQAEIQFRREELALKQQELQMRQQEMALDAQMKEREVAINAEAMEHKAMIDRESMDHGAELEREASERETEASERKHELSVEVMEAKAKQAKRPSPSKEK